MIETSRLYLKLLDQDDENNIITWRNKREIIDSFFSYTGITIEEHRTWFRNYLNNKTRMEFIIIKKENNQKIGTIGLSDIDFKNQKSEYGILIGETAEQGKGYAKESTLEIIRYGFKELNLRKIYLKVFKDNDRAINMYRKIGFLEDGILRSEIFKNGIFKDVLIMSILKHECYEKYEKSCY